VIEQMEAIIVGRDDEYWQCELKSWHFSINSASFNSCRCHALQNSLSINHRSNSCNSMTSSVGVKSICSYYAQMDQFYPPCLNHHPRFSSSAARMLKSFAVCILPLFMANSAPF